MTRPPARDDGGPGARAAVPAVTAALWATFTSGFAGATPVIVDIAPDVTLGHYNLDINGDLVPEYTFHTSFGCVVGCFNDNDVEAGPGNGVAHNPFDPLGYVAALSHGEMVDAGLTYVSDPGALLSGTKVYPIALPTDRYGNFHDVGTAYVGLQFVLPGTGTHYGWVEAVGVDGQLTLARYGYETVADVGIRTPAAVPEPGSLALLAAGAAGVLALRRRPRR